MIHELIEPKKRATKSNATKKGRTVSELRACGDNIGNSDNENKETGSASSTFIPPWLRNSLGLSHRTNQRHSTLDQRAGKTNLKHKELTYNDLDPSASNTELGCAIRDPCKLGNSPENCQAQIENVQNLDSSERDNEKSASILPWSRPGKIPESESMCTTSDLKTIKKNDSKIMSAEATAAVIERSVVKDEDKKKVKSLRTKYRTKKSIANEPIQEICKSEVDHLLEAKAKEVIDCYSKKDVHSVSSEIKQLEAKLILLGGKCRDEDLSKLSEQELRILREIKEQTGNKADFDKLMYHLKEASLKEWFRSSEAGVKIHSEKKDDVKSEKNTREPVQNSQLESKEFKLDSDKDSSKSTDDETDIKRFSEFLSKNKNVDEKRKCLEEVRNYFERKRRTRLTKRRFTEDNKLPKSEEYIQEKKDDCPNERPAVKNMPIRVTNKEKKKKFIPCNEEVVEKAVSETLQKFMNLYNFHISSSMMGSMRRNILEAIKSDSLESSESKKTLTEHGDTHEVTDYRKREMTAAKAMNGATENVGAVPITSVASVEQLFPVKCKEFKKTFFKTLAEHENTKDVQKVNNTVFENDNFKRLKKEFENCLKLIAHHSDAAELKIQSLVLEKEDSESSKGLRFLYNFAKKTIEFVQSGQEQFKPSLQCFSGKTSDAETQTVCRVEATKKSLKTQTGPLLGTREQGLQTDEKIHLTRLTQTEMEKTERNYSCEELKELDNINISPGLYRMIMSKDFGRFYLYPEQENENCENEKLAPKRTFSSETKCIRCQNSKTTPRVNKSLSKFKSSRELNNYYKDRARFRRCKKKMTRTKLNLNSKSSESKMDDPTLNYLFMREPVVNSSTSENNELKKKISEYTEANADPGIASKADAVDGSKYYLLWNGEKIDPGSDLKTHVENLIQERLIERSQWPKATNVINYSFMEDAECEIQEAIGSAAVVEPEASFCKDEYSSQGDGYSTCANNTVVGNSPGQDQLDPRHIVVGKELTKGKIREKSVRHIGTQNSQQTSLRVNKMKSSSKGRSLSKVGRAKRNKHSRYRQKCGKGNNRVDFRALVNFLNAIKEIRRECLEGENGGTGETSLGSSSGIDDSTSSSVIKTYDGNLVGSSVSDIKSKNELDEMEMKSRLKTVLEDSINQLSRHQKGDDYALEHSNAASSSADSRQWELLEGVLNSISLKQQKSLWNDVRRFIKAKIGRDINTEGAHEVCIEIEQDVPKTDIAEHTVMARGHYVRNEGDVEVEIDLTLDDLQKILSQRQKKMQRKNSQNSSKILSSASTRSSFTREDFRKCRKYICKLSHLGAFEKCSDVNKSLKKTSLKMLRKNK